MQKEPHENSEHAAPAIRQVKLSLNADSAIEPKSEKSDVVGDLPESTSIPVASNDLVIERVASNRSHSTPLQDKRKTSANTERVTKKTRSTKKSRATLSSKESARAKLSNLGLSESGQLTLQDQKKLGARIYRLKSYTTVGKINRKFAQDKQQRWLRNVLALVMLVVILIVLFVIYNPVKDILDVRKMLGLDSPFRTMASETVSDRPEPSVIP